MQQSPKKDIYPTKCHNNLNLLNILVKISTNTPSMICVIRKNCKTLRVLICDNHTFVGDGYNLWRFFYAVRYKYRCFHTMLHVTVP